MLDLRKVAKRYVLGWCAALDCRECSHLRSKDDFLSSLIMKIDSEKLKNGIHKQPGIDSCEWFTVVLRTFSFIHPTDRARLVNTLKVRCTTVERGDLRFLLSF